MTMATPAHGTGPSSGTRKVCRVCHRQRLRVISVHLHTWHLTQVAIVHSCSRLMCCCTYLYTPLQTLTTVSTAAVIMETTSMQSAKAVTAETLVWQQQRMSSGSWR
jgi:cell fate regulator YaaT (PSP1 superfamily)